MQNNVYHINGKKNICWVVQRTKHGEVRGTRTEKTEKIRRHRIWREEKQEMKRKEEKRLQSLRIDLLLFRVKDDWPKIVVQSGRWFLKKTQEVCSFVSNILRWIKNFKYVKRKTVCTTDVFSTAILIQFKT